MSKHGADYNEQFTDVCPTCHGEGSVAKGEVVEINLSEFMPKPDRATVVHFDYNDWENLEDWLRTKLTTLATKTDKQ